MSIKVWWFIFWNILVQLTIRNEWQVGKPFYEMRQELPVAASRTCQFNFLRVKYPIKPFLWGSATRFLLCLDNVRGIVRRCSTSPQESFALLCINIAGKVKVGTFTGLKFEQRKDNHRVDRCCHIDYLLCPPLRIHFWSQYFLTLLFFKLQKRKLIFATFHEFNHLLWIPTIHLFFKMISEKISWYIDCELVLIGKGRRYREESRLR